MATDKIFNLIILDESGSMESIKKATISGFNELVQTIKGIEKKYPDQQHFISFITFNGLGIKTHLDKEKASNLSQMDRKNYRPDSNTPLYDAIGLSVLKLRIDLAGQENTNVLVTILTDGEENASKEFTGQQVKAIIDEQKAQGWTFTYIGANHNVERAAAAMSITNTMNFAANDEDVKEMFLKEQSSRIRYSNRISNKDFSHENYYQDPDASTEPKKA
ncbi:MAG: VWA domain-containing protein [Lentimicrobium sp.]|jgi:Mg-chelatase subunit ChlD|nr:VWA domain-containing protein [Lentimicrobium sp.]